jgi:hypothetical protein
LNGQSGGVPTSGAHSSPTIEAVGAPLQSMNIYGCSSTTFYGQRFALGEFHPVLAQVCRVAGAANATLASDIVDLDQPAAACPP